MFRAHSYLRGILALVFVSYISTAVFAAPASEAKPHWLLVSSSHFSVLTDADEKKANEVLLRMEQMRAIFAQLLQRTKLVMPEPLDIIAFNTREEYVQFAPAHNGQAVATSGFFLPGEDRNFIGLDLSDDQSWRTVSEPLARVYLNYNYPPTQAWFDEGLAKYFSSLRLSDTQASIGSDPASFIAQLTSTAWQPLAELCAERSGDDKAMPPIFSAQSWILMHYLLSQDKLSETGTYMGLVEARNLPIAEAIHQAYGVSPDQFEQSLKDYFHAIAAALQLQQNSQVAVPATARNPVHDLPAPLSPLDVGTSLRRLPEFEAKARVDEFAIRVPEHREQAVNELQSLMILPKQETAIGHRALAWVHMQKLEYDEAFEELASATGVDAADPWTRYYLALAKFQQAANTGNPMQGIANMMQDLHTVLDWNPDFAEAYNMLAMAQLQGGGMSAAAASMHPAIQLSPRNESYLLNLASIYLAGKKWDNATALLNRLKDSRDSEIASAAQKDLNDLPMLKKYGVAPQKKTEAEASQPAVIFNNTDDDATSGEQATPPPEPGPDLRKTEFLRGNLISVDCSQSPAAIVSISNGRKTVRLRTEDYRALQVIGADAFSCNWKNVPAEVNYKTGGKADGDLVSLELR